MGTKKNGFNTGIASEYLVLSMLYRLDIEAYMTMGNRKSVDIWVMKDGKPDISIDVKSVRGYASIPVNNMVVKKNHFIVFVIYKNKFDDLYVMPDFYIVPSEEAEKKIHEYKKERRIHPIHDLKDYKGTWERFLI